MRQQVGVASPHICCAYAVCAVAGLMKFSAAKCDCQMNMQPGEEGGEEGKGEGVGFCCCLHESKAHRLI